jgi:AraC-like DNA-binding protein
MLTGFAARIESSHGIRMRRHLSNQVEKYLNSLNNKDNISEQLKRRLADLLARGEANADSACRAMQLSRRTLQRRLKAERTSFQKVLKEVRAELAVRYLSDRRLKSLEVAMLLGYNNFSSFTTGPALPAGTALAGPIYDMIRGCVSEEQPCARC